MALTLHKIFQTEAAKRSGHLKVLSDYGIIVLDAGMPY